MVHLLALLLAELDRLLGGLVGETCEGLLHLLLYILVADLGLGLTAVATTVVAVAVATALASALVATLAVLAVTRLLALVGTETGLLCSLVDIYLLLADALALLARVVLGATLVLSLLLGAGALVDGREVDLAEHLQLGTLRGATEAERLVLLFGRLGLGRFLGGCGLCGCGRLCGSGFGSLLLFLLLGLTLSLGACGLGLGLFGTLAGLAFGFLTVSLLALRFLACGFLLFGLDSCGLLLFSLLTLGFLACCGFCVGLFNSCVRDSLHA